MNGKNVEKLVLAGRLIVSGILLSLLVFTTVPNLHNNSRQTSGDSSIDTFFLATNFTPEINVPIAGESKPESIKNQPGIEVADDGSSKDDASVNDSPDSSNENNPGQDVGSNQAVSSYPANYYSNQSSNSVNLNSSTNSVKSSNASSSIKTAPSSTAPSNASGANTKSSTYVDENYEHIDSASPSPIPYIAPANHDNDNSTSDQPSKDLNPSTPSASATSDSTIED